MSLVNSNKGLSGVLPKFNNLSGTIPPSAFPPGFSSLIFRDLVNTETLSGNKTLAESDAISHFLNPNGADRDVNLPATPSTGLFYQIKNIGSANTLTVKNSGGTAIGNPLAVGIVSGYQYDGSTWQIV